MTKITITLIPIFTKDEYSNAINDFLHLKELYILTNTLHIYITIYHLEGKEGHCLANGMVMAARAM